MTDTSSSLNLTRGLLGPTLLRLGVPLFMGMVMISSVGIVDAYFVGELGTEALAAFGLCFPLVMLIQGMMFGLANGITASVAHVRGEREGQPLGRREWVLVRTAIVAALGVAGCLALVGLTLAPVVFASTASEPELVDLALQYFRPFLISALLLAVPVSVTASMRGLGETRSSAISMGLSSVFNAALDPVLMNGWGPIPALGLSGVSYATVVANTIAASYGLWLLRRTFRGASQKPEPEASARRGLRSIAAVAGPAMLAQAMGPVSGVVITTLMAQQGTAALAGLSIIQRVDLIILMVAVAAGSALMPIAAQSWAGGQRERAARALRLCRRTMGAWGVGIALVLIALTGPIAGLFTDDPAVVDVVATAFWFRPIGFASAGLNIVTMSGFNSIGKPLRATKLSGLLTLVLLPTLTYSFSQSYGVAGIFGGAALALATAASIGTYWMVQEGLTPGRAETSDHDVPQGQAEVG